jgi:hypothetical protein
MVTKRELILLKALLEYANDSNWTEDGQGIARYFYIGGMKPGCAIAEEAIEKYLNEGGKS